MPIHRLGLTDKKQTDGTGQPSNLNKLYQLQDGHIAKYVHVRNDPDKNSQTNAYVLYVGSEGRAVYPLLWGEAKDFEYCDPARFVIADGGHALYFDLEVSGCCPECGGR